MAGWFTPRPRFARSGGPPMVNRGGFHFGSANATRLSPPDSQTVMAHFMWAIQLLSRPVAMPPG